MTEEKLEGVNAEVNAEITEAEVVETAETVEAAAEPAEEAAEVVEQLPAKKQRSRKKKVETQEVKMVAEINKTIEVITICKTDFIANTSRRAAYFMINYR